MLGDFPEFKIAKLEQTTFDEEKLDDTKPLTVVQVDGLVILKILQHVREYLPEPVFGHLMGIGTGSTLKVTHCFPLVNNNGKDGEEGTYDDQDYQESIQQNMRRMNIDSLVNGYYTTTLLENHITWHFIETLYIYQSELGEHSVGLIFNPLKTLHGKLYLKALRLKPEFMQMMAESQNTKDFSQSVINDKRITTADLFQEIPIQLHNTHLVDQFLWELGSSKDYATGTTELNSVAYDKALSSYQTLVATAMVENTEQLLQDLARYHEDNSKPDKKGSRSDTLYQSAAISHLSRHLCDVSQVGFESVSLCESLQKELRN